MAQVDAFKVYYALIGAQAFVQLVFAHIYGIDALGPPLQQAVRKAAGGSARVQAHKVGHIQLEMLKDGQKFVSATAHVAFRFQQGKNRVRSKRMPRFGHYLRRRAGNRMLKDDLARHAAGVAPRE